MPSKSKKQAKFMRAVAHGWQPTRTDAPPVSVAKEFVAADKKAGMYEGGLAPMADIIQRGMAPGLNFYEGGEVQAGIGGMIKRLLEQKKREEDPNWEPWMRYGTEAVKWKDVPGDGIKKYFNFMNMKKLGWQPSFLPKGGEEGKYTKEELKELTFFPPTPTGLGDTTVPTTPGYDPYYGRGPGSVPPRGGGPRGRRNGGGRRGPPGRRPPPGEPPPPRIIPPGRPPGGDLVPPLTGVPPDYVPPDPRAGRDTEYSRALRAHRERVAASLGFPGYEEGGEVKGYQEGGTARADNPYPEGSSRWRLWERKHGRDPNEPEPKAAEEAPPVEEEEEELSWWARVVGGEKEEARQSRTERELEKLEENARGGRVGYQAGGYARAPYGGVPPRIAGMMKPRMGGVPPRLDPRAMPPQATTQPVGPMGGLQQVTGGPRPDPRAMPPVSQRIPRMSTPLRLPPGMDPRRSGPKLGPPPGVPRDYAGPMGGARLPPSMRGLLQRRMMENRPRRAIPGPAGAGGAGNRVGMTDQQGGLARALQRGTGRPPMSRRQGFYR